MTKNNELVFYTPEERARLEEKRRIQADKTIDNTLAEIFSPVNFVIAYEQGELTEGEVITGFQYLIDSGLVWQLQGSYGRQAVQLIEAGLCTR